MSDRLRVLYSFPLKIGADRICYTAWEQVRGLATAGADVTVFPGSVARPLPASVAVRPTLARGRFRIPYRVLGHDNAFQLHDFLVAKRLERAASSFDIVHTWPSGARRTLETANRLGVPTVLERANAHTGLAYQIVGAECKRIGVSLPPGSEHAYNPAVLRHEEREFALAGHLLCPSDFVEHSFLDRGFSPDKIIRHTYGFDPERFYPDPERYSDDITMLFAGFAAVRKGLHIALEAWLQSPVSKSGTFLIAGDILPSYREKLGPWLAHHSVQVLGYRTDIPDLMRRSDLFVLPSFEEGFGLVCLEAMASGSVPLVSTACTELCVHENNALVHAPGDVQALTEHISMIGRDRSLLARLRAEAIDSSRWRTWDYAGRQLLEAYRQALTSPAKRVA
jgi:glycosyltransferase involved in cell wall biosynthesis